MKKKTNDQGSPRVARIPQPTTLFTPFLNPSLLVSYQTLIYPGPPSGSGYLYSPWNPL
ncbi:hypothetical protein BDD12DRAFT_829321 [Trichophaea hybrida]|nr:hypothetical protein BDD12DRAFT_829321 [Trichophaea hybrida]